MLFLCCFTALRDETKDALLAHIRPDDHVRFVYTGHDEQAYARELLAAWESGHDFALVEHDNILEPRIVDVFHDCPEPYCAVPYDWTTNRAPALGMTRFRGSFTVAHPDAMRFAATQPSAWGKPGHWKSVGWSLTEAYLHHRHGIRPHTHLPACVHLNETQRLRPDVAHLSDEEHLRLVGLEPAA